MVKEWKFEINYLTWLINLSCIQPPKSRKGKGKSVTWTWCCLGHRNPRFKFIFKTCLFSPNLSLFTCLFHTHRHLVAKPCRSNISFKILWQCLVKCWLQIFFHIFYLCFQGTGKPLLLSSIATNVKTMKYYLIKIRFKIYLGYKSNFQIIKNLLINYNIINHFYPPNKIYG